MIATTESPGRTAFSFSRPADQLKGWKVVAWGALKPRIDVFEGSGKARTGLFGANNPVNEIDPVGLWFSYKTGNATFWNNWTNTFKRLWDSNGPAGKKFRKMWQDLNDCKREVSIGPDPSLPDDWAWSVEMAMRFSDNGHSLSSSTIGEEFQHAHDYLTGEDQPPPGMDYRQYNDSRNPPYGRGPQFAIDVSNALGNQNRPR